MSDSYPARVVDAHDNYGRGGDLALYPEDRREVMQTLRNSLYPGASWASIDMVLAWCRVNQVDPFLKPVHIVPMSVKKPGTDIYEWRDVLMPGIADYRIKAARSGQYIGKSEPVFGPTVEYNLSGAIVQVPEFCTITVRRLVMGQIAEFAATEYWKENYAVAKRGTLAPNAMWARRGRGQLAKCAEAQALRMAFPEFNGGMATAEEMEGKTFDYPQAHELPPIARGMSKLDTLANSIAPPPAAEEEAAQDDGPETQADAPEAAREPPANGQTRLDAAFETTLERFGKMTSAEIEAAVQTEFYKGMIRALNDAGRSADIAQLAKIRTASMRRAPQADDDTFPGDKPVQE
ncbi:MAG: phage recombination protein Bet [Bradyrhizobium sp.]|nr:phage recombination protein Bet [Bradyrhizobium sp.]